MFNPTNYINTILKPEIIDTVYAKDVNDLKAIFGSNDPVQEGSVIKTTFEVARSSNVGTFGIGDTDVASYTSTLVNPYWTKAYVQEAVDIPIIKLNEAGSDAKRMAIMDKAMDGAVKNLSNKFFDLAMTQLAADVDSTATYGDGALSRTTYTSLASYEDGTSTAITLAALRTMSKACLYSTAANTSQNAMDYVWLFSSGPYNTFKPLANAEHSLVINDVRQGQALDLGRQSIASWDGSDVWAPKGVTAGEIYYLRKGDVKIQDHMPTMVIQKDSNAAVYHYVLYAGLNLYVENPGAQGKLTSRT